MKLLPSRSGQFVPGEDCADRAATAELVQAARGSDPPPRVTVILTHFGCEDYLAEAVASILQQTFKALELWVVDDCSPSDLWATKLARWRGDPRLRLFRSSRNVGTYRLKALCIDHIDSGYIGFQDADDASEPQRIEVQIREMERRRLDVVGTGYIISNERGEPVGRKRMPRSCNWLFRLGRVFIVHHPTTLVRRTVFDRIGSFDGNTRMGADCDFMLRAAHRFQVGNVRPLLYRYRLRSGSLTAAPATGFGSDARVAYSRQMWERERLRKKKPDDVSLRPLPIDMDFTVTELA
jgi:glycosyltransferase involved in cell wall biosynthesis